MKSQSSRNYSVSISSCDMAFRVRKRERSEPALGMCEVCGRIGPPILRGRQILDEIFLYTV